MNPFRNLQRLFLAVIVTVTATTAWADWELDSTNSIINFISTKNDSVAEIHSLPSLVGYIGADGKMQITMDMESVQTLIEVRDERMRELLFETVKFPVATINADVDPDVLAIISEGGVVTAEFPLTLSLHGAEKALTASLVVVGEGDNRLRVFSAKPLLINAADFGLATGVAALQEIAGLNAISTAVPVTVQLQFERVR